MKKLTKTLSLVLVVAMVLSLCVIGAGATFTDNDKITKDYTEAVTIATDLGIVSGVGNNTFAPAGTFTRAQAAVILTRLTLGATADKYVPSKVTFKDVPTSFWGYKFVEYAAQSGYVAGVGNGNYNPNATLTGYQWAAMLMKVLNITVPSTGSDWQINTAKAYYGADTKFSDVAISAANITREAATQMAYDALFAGTSKTTGYPVYLRTYNADGTAYTDALVKTYPSITDAAAATTALNNGAGYTANAKAGANVKYYYYGTETTSTTTGTLAYTVFGVTKGTGVDTFGRPSTTYMTKTAKLATTYGWNASAYTTAAKTFANVAVATYTTPVTFGTLYTTLGSAATFDKANSYTNGTKDTIVSSETAVAVAKNDSTKTVGGFGIVTEIYKVDTNKYVTVQTQYTLGTVAVSAAAASKTRGAYTSYTLNGAAYKVFSSVVDAERDVNTASVTGTVANGDTVLYAIINADHNNGANFAYVVVPTTVSGVLTAVSSNGVMTIDGKTYNYSAVSGHSMPTPATTAQKFYADQYGNIIKSYTDVSVTNWALVLTKSTYSTLTDGKLSTAYTVTVALPDGTTKDLAVSYDTYGAATSGTTVTYALNATGKLYVLTTVASQTTTKVAGATVDSDYVSGRETTLATGFTKGTAALVESTLYANAATKFVFVNYATNENGVRVANGTVTVYTGIDNVPTTKGTGLNIYALDINTKAADKIADVVYVVTDLNATVTSNYTYVVGTYSLTATAKVYNTIVNGEPSTISIPLNATGAELAAHTLYKSISVNSSNVVAVEAAEGSAATLTNKGGAVFAGDTYLTSVGSTVPVYIFNNVDDSCTKTTVTAFDSGVAVVAYGMAKDASGAVTAVYAVVHQA